MQIVVLEGGRHTRDSGSGTRIVTLVEKRSSLSDRRQVLERRRQRSARNPARDRKSLVEFRHRAIEQSVRRFRPTEGERTVGRLKADRHSAAVILGEKNVREPIESQV